MDDHSPKTAFHTMEPSNQLIVGLTGYYSSGKSTVAKLFEARNYLLIEVDELGHQGLVDKSSEIIQSFGEKILTPKGLIDRKKLGKLVFNNREHLTRLEQILHPQMIQQVRDIIKKTTYKKVLINAAILIEMKLHLLCDKVIVINASIDDLIQWGMTRDCLTSEQVKQRLKNQLPMNLRKQHADFIIENEGTLKELKEKANKLINSLDEDLL
ncbi:MAG: dephospho-CoA kinase [bacterium]|nr:MAG: dephospho-CoA kinase [bacterium]